jgi:hypothetical protein
MGTNCINYPKFKDSRVLASWQIEGSYHELGMLRVETEWAKTLCFRVLKERST